MVNEIKEKINQKIFDEAFTLKELSNKFLLDKLDRDLRLFNFFEQEIKDIRKELGSRL